MLWEFVISVAGALSLSSVKFQVLSQNFLGIVHGIDEEEHAEMLRELHATFINIQELEARTREYNPAAEYVKSMQWPQVVWVRENLSLLSE